MRPLFQHARGLGSRLSDNARESLSRWRDVLSWSAVEVRKGKLNVQAPVLAWARARGSPPRLAAVALIEDQWHFCNAEPPREITRRKRRAPSRQAPTRAARSVARSKCSPRSDSQITGLEITAADLLARVVAQGTRYHSLKRRRRCRSNPEEGLRERGRSPRTRSCILVGGSGARQARRH